jgi:hypothetical protein
MYSYLHKTTNSIFQYNKHTGKIIFGIIVICCSYLIWYFLYYKNKKIIHEFIDFEIKRTLSKLFTNNTSIISFLSKEINSILTHPQFQEQVNLFILNNYIHNDKLRLHIQNKSKEFIIDYLQSENAVIHISNIIKFFINSEFGRNKIKELLYNYMELNGKEYLTDLLEMKIIQMINDEDFRTYVCNEINNEIQKSLKQKGNIQYMIVSLKKNLKFSYIRLDLKVIVIIYNIYI